MTVTVLYFASLRDAAGIDAEVVELPTSLAALYESLRERHGFSFGQQSLRVAVDGAFARWSDRISDGAEVAFIPPVSGG
ncbi:MAG: MoaD/ThiS family protein [Frankiaceae bacterium]|nr:MoaD/ThiS family protein [Arenimonas sp.]